MIMILDVDVTAERRHYNTHRPIGRYHNPRPERPSNLRTLRPSGRSILRTFPSEPFEPSEPYEPSRRRRVQGPSILRTFLFTTLRHNPPPSGGHNPRGEAPSTFPSEPSEPFEPSYNMFGRGRLEDLSLLDLSPLQHEHAFGIMVIGAIEDIPLNPV